MKKIKCPVCKVYGMVKSKWGETSYNLYKCAYCNGEGTVCDIEDHKNEL